MLSYSRLVFAVLVLSAVGCERSLTFDAQGYPHGTGEKVYNYRSGAVQLREDYVDGKLVRSRWFKPDGTPVQETRWIDGSGVGIYLREDGSIRTRMPYVNGVAEGPATEYDEAGNVTKIVQYHRGEGVTTAVSPTSQADQPAPANHVARQAAAPTVPSNPNLGTYVGEWAGNDGFQLSVARNADGSTTISLPPNATWDSVVNNVRFEGAALHFDLYMYYKGNEDFTTITNTVGDHPYSGVRNEVTLSRGEAPDTLKLRWVTKDLPQGDESVLRRHNG